MRVERALVMLRDDSDPALVGRRGRPRSAAGPDRPSLRRGRGNGGTRDEDGRSAAGGRLRLYSRPIRHSVTEGVRCRRGGADPAREGRAGCAHRRHHRPGPQVRRARAGDPRRRLAELGAVALEQARMREQLEHAVRPASRRWRRRSTCATTTRASTPRRSCDLASRRAADGSERRGPVGAGDRRAAARRRQDRCSGRRAAQGRPARRRRVGGHAPAPGVGGADVAPDTRAEARVAHRAPRPRALGRRRAIRTACAPRASRSKAGSSWPATPTTR